MKVAEKLKLKPLPAKPTLAAYRARRAELEKAVASGKVKGKLLQRAQEYIRATDFRIRKLQQADQMPSDAKRGLKPTSIAPVIQKLATAAQEPVQNPKAKRAGKKAHPDQMQLPGFLQGLDLVRIEELIAERIADEKMKLVHAALEERGALEIRVRKTK